MAAETASLTASLVDRAAARFRVEHALALTPVGASIEPAPAETPLFCEKGRASVSPLAAFTPATVRRPRLWLRLTAAERRRVKVAAAFFGQSTAAFLRDALAAFMDNLLPLAAVRPAGGRPPTGPSREPRVKLDVRVDANLHAAIRSAAAQRGETIQTLLMTAIDVHLARLIDSSAAKNLRPLLEAFDASTAVHLGADVIDFPTPRRVVASAPLQRRRAAR